MRHIYMTYVYFQKFEPVVVIVEILMHVKHFVKGFIDQRDQS